MQFPIEVVPQDQCRTIWELGEREGFQVKNNEEFELNTFGVDYFS
jgi:hypothetical protein